MTTDLTPRDRAVLAAMAAGRGIVVNDRILVDGLPLADQFVAARLVAAGLLDAVETSGSPLRAA